ncbi:hypothetical protein BDY17DRAFT_292006 [Neohortaea acidophila]|uniref:Uncharacterized protein n=1 Tax=Neohortaea acidophila TaxID=245834 RepID=A0A6A6Q2H8_9PEZI|nr:uncharacterized protein BDY17DRAFT_292006 [Neohortaea acidophila]KAF2486728.1 hypothetical protein BDY17DRAFT_292006 [Neohortaea acidophila]
MIGSRIGWLLYYDQFSQLDFLGSYDQLNYHADRALSTDTTQRALRCCIVTLLLYAFALHGF